MLDNYDGLQSDLHQIFYCEKNFSGTKAPGHQYTKRWLNIDFIGPVSDQNIAFIADKIRKRNYWKNDPVVEGLRTWQRVSEVRMKYILLCYKFH